MLSIEDLYKQCRLIDRTEKHEKERQFILAENKENLKTLDTIMLLN